jgi:hypothetical protein
MLLGLLMCALPAQATVLNLTCTLVSAGYNGSDVSCAPECATFHLLVDASLGRVKWQSWPWTSAFIDESNIKWGESPWSYQLDRYTGELHEIAQIASSTDFNVWRCKALRRQF